MRFEQPWMLVLLVVPLLWWAQAQRKAYSRFAVTAKAFMLGLIIAALAQPVLDVPQQKLGIVLLADTSLSVGDEGLRQASAWIQQVEGARGRHLLQVLPFARATRPRSEEEAQHGLRFAPGSDARATNLEVAVREGIAALPAGYAGRLVLVSDGLENQGSLMAAASAARRLGIAIDTYPLPGRPRPALRIESVSLPAAVFTGERFPIELEVTAPRSARGTLEIAAEGKVLGSSQVKIQPGRNRLRATASVNVAGAINISGVLRAEGLGETRFDQALVLRKPRILYVSQDPPGVEQHLLSAWEAAQFEVRKATEVPAEIPADIQVVVLNNQDLKRLPDNFKQSLEEFTKQGGGVLVIGGEKNVYVQGDGNSEDALERTLPAKLAPPRSPEGTAVVLIIDKSSSMEGRKIELARLSAIGVVENLRAIDLVGVLIFDNSFQWAVPIRRAEDRTLIKRLIAGITPDGGTQIAPALAEAYRRVLPVRATYKHIVLLTDGISEEGDSLSLAREAAQNRVTISTVGLGQDVNRAYLEKVASFARGRSYFLVDPSNLEQILLKDVMEHTGSTAIERPVKPVVVRAAEILEGVGMDQAPPLRGYVKFVAKPGANVLLQADGRDPLLVNWQYGLGRAAVFTSDAKSRWAESWIAWRGFDRFWINVLRDLLPHGDKSESSVKFDPARGVLTVQYRLARGVSAPDALPTVYVLGPDHFREVLPIRKYADGLYQGEVVISDRQGLFRIRPLEESLLFPETGFYRQEAETSEYGSDERLLRELARYTGGIFRPTPEGVFRAPSRSPIVRQPLWPVLLVLAMCANLAELVQRKWMGIAGLWARFRAVHS
jgi:uncharacterized membrane protein/uncharacterized protein YegL